MFKLIAIEDVQHAGEGRVVCLHYIPNGPDIRSLSASLLGRLL
jgi:hypothetical protein